MKYPIFVFLITLSFLVTSYKITYSEGSLSPEYISSTGEEFVFATTYPDGEKYGYQLWHKWPMVSGGKLSYQDYVGRKGKLEESIIYESSGISKFRKAVMENGEVLYVHVIGNVYLSGIYFLKDLAKAKTLIGRIVWINNANTVRPQMLITDNTMISYPTHHLEPVRVIDVVLESYGYAYGSGPFFLKVKKLSGEEGLIKYNDRYFCTSNPFPQGTSIKIKQAVEQRKIMIGMTREQASLSWGEPDKVNKSVGSWGVKEQWVYGNQYLYFTNGRLDSFQTSN
jgi:hypothetical protein